MTSSHPSQNLVSNISVEVTCLIEDKKAKAIYRALTPDLNSIGRDAKVKIRLNGGEIHFDVSSKDLGDIKAFLTSFLKLIGAASSTINSVST